MSLNAIPFYTSLSLISSSVHFGRVSLPHKAPVGQAVTADAYLAGYRTQEGTKLSRTYKLNYSIDLIKRAHGG